MTSFKEAPHPAQFILSEDEGQLSRDNITIAAGQQFPPGTVLVNGAGGYVPYTGGAGPLAIGIYGAKTDPGETLQIAAITRSAEVNRHTIAWPDGYTDAEIDAAATELAKQFVIVRGAPLPSPNQTVMADSESRRSEPDAPQRSVPRRSE